MHLTYCTKLCIAACVILFECKISGNDANTTDKLIQVWWLSWHQCHLHDNNIMSCNWLLINLEQDIDLIHKQYVY